MVRTDALECGDGAYGNSRNSPDQCSAFVGVATRGTSRVSALTGVVSAWEIQKRQEATGVGSDLVLCAFTALDRAFVGRGEPAIRAGVGCDPACRPMDHFVQKSGGAWLRSSGGLESAG